MSVTARSEAADEVPPGAGPVDADTIRATVARALLRSSCPPERALLEEQFTLLCGHVALLLPDMRARVEQLPPRTADRYTLSIRLDDHRAQIGRPLAEGEDDAHAQVRRLALACRWLLAGRQRPQ